MGPLRLRTGAAITVATWRKLPASASTFFVALATTVIDAPVQRGAHDSHGKRLWHLRHVFGVCLLISMAASAVLAQSATSLKKPSRNAYVVLIGGMDSDPTPAQIAGTARRSAGNSGLYQLRGDLDHPHIMTEYFNWNGTGAGQIQARKKSDAAIIAESIRGHVQRHPRDQVILIGNSWGGHTTWDVCRTLVDSPTPVAIDYVIFLDPSSAGRANSARPKHLPININRATNYYTRNVFGWRHWPQDERIENIDLGDPQHGFLSKGGPAYDAQFDFSAHVAAEWDDRIHAAMRQKIVDLVPE